MISYTNTFTPLDLWGPSRVRSIYSGLAYPIIICLRRDRYVLTVCWTEHCAASISWGDPVPDAWHGYYCKAISQVGKPVPPGEAGGLCTKLGMKAKSDS